MVISSKALPKAPLLNPSSSSRASTGWMKAVLPFNMALGSVGTFVQLYILGLGGSVVDVSLALTLYNLASVPSLMLWGFVTDRVHRRRLMIVGSFLSTSLLLSLFIVASSMASVLLLYALLALSTSASTAPLNLLIMETEEKPRWATAFARFSLIVSVGQTLGLLLGALWSLHLPLRYFSALLSLLSLTSTCLAVALVKEPPVIFERHVIVMNKHSFSERLKHAPYMFLRAPRASDFKKLFRQLKHELTSYVPTLYLSIFLFYISSGLFNTSLIPSLRSKGLSDLTVFSIMAITMVVQTLSFEYARHYVERRPLLRAVVEGLMLRSACYGLFGITVYSTSGHLFLALTLLLYPLAGGLAYAMYYTASNALVFHTLHDRHQGASLGVYSSLVGFATVAGSLISGLASLYMGFHATFMAASACLILSAALARRLVNHHYS